MVIGIKVTAKDTLTLTFDTLKDAKISHKVLAGMELPLEDFKETNEVTILPVGEGKFGVYTTQDNKLAIHLINAKIGFENDKFIDPKISPSGEPYKALQLFFSILGVTYDEVHYSIFTDDPDKKLNTKLGNSQLCCAAGARGIETPTDIYFNLNLITPEVNSEYIINSENSILRSPIRLRKLLTEFKISGNEMLAEAGSESSSLQILSGDLTPSREKLIIESGSSEVSKFTPENQKLAGISASILVVNPALRYLDDGINGVNKDKALADYYSEVFSVDGLSHIATSLIVPVAIELLGFSAAPSLPNFAAYITDNFFLQGLIQGSAFEVAKLGFDSISTLAGNIPCLYNCEEAIN